MPPKRGASPPSFDLVGESGPLRTLLVDLWGSRDLILALSRKDFFVQYRRASFGVLWALAMPLLQAGVLAVVIPRLVQLDVGGSYLVFVFGGTIVWTLFSTSLNSAAGSIVDGQDLSTRVYFPRLVLPIETVLAKLYGFVPSAVLLAAMALATGSATPRLLAIVPATMLIAALTMAMSACLAALHVYFRDVRYIVQAALVAWFYVTPIIYPLDAVSGIRRWLEINPVTGAIELIRVATVGADTGWLTPVLWTMGWTVVFGVAALALHRRFDRVFVDLL